MREAAAGATKPSGRSLETASGAKNDHAQRKEILALAQAREIDVILVTELTRGGRSMLDLFHTDARASPCVRPRRKAVPVYTLCVQPKRQGIITERASTTSMEPLYDQRGIVFRP